MIDAIDQAAGLSPDDTLYQTRRFRQEFVQGAQQCRQSVLQPENDAGLRPELRIALARRMALLNNDRPLMAEYDALLATLSPGETLMALANGENEPGGSFAPLIRHVDLVTLDPGRARAEDIRLLEQAGLTSAQIVALSELIAFVNFQTRVAAGLRLMRSA